ncbi:MAG: hypothetical protein WAW11_04030 [Patescibacteria group bacterium]
MSVIIFAVVCFFVVSCKVNPSEVTDEYAKEFVKKVKYVQDEKTGLCYAIVATRVTGSTDQNGISWTWVPCDSVKKYLVK